MFLRGTSSGCGWPKCHDSHGKIKHILMLGPELTYCDRQLKSIPEQLWYASFSMIISKRYVMYIDYNCRKE